MRKKSSGNTDQNAARHAPPGDPAHRADHYWNLPKYSQIIEPYQFGHPWKKRTCLWLKGLPPLVPTEIVKPTSCWVETNGRTCRTKLRGEKGARSPKDRAKTFPGIANAMAAQWGEKEGF